MARLAHPGRPDGRPARSPRLNSSSGACPAIDDEGVALAVQPPAATDSLWRLSEDTRPSIAKTTNGKDVDSAMGRSVVPGSDVDRATTVTNTGSLALTRVRVRDIDAAGKVVSSDTIAALAPGQIDNADGVGDGDSQASFTTL